MTTDDVKQIVLCDIDHVISDAFWRDGMLQGADTDYDQYHYLGKEDKSHDDMVKLLWAMSSSGFYTIVGLTARPEKWRKQTMDWMIANEVPLDDLLMRPNNDYSPSPKVKVDLINQHYKDRLHRISFVIDDRDDVVTAIKAINLNVFQYHMKRSEHV